MISRFATKSRDKADYNFGIDLYMAPSNMLLRKYSNTGYKNEIVIATNNHSIGINENMKTSAIPSDSFNDRGE